MTRTYLQSDGLGMRYGERWLFRGLCLRLDSEHVALVGRNGAGKSSLLELLAGRLPPTEGTVRSGGRVEYVEQSLPVCEMSPGQQRRRKLAASLDSGSAILLWDEPTADLDEESVEWLLERLTRHKCGLLVATHDRRMLAQFSHFFLLEDSGCRTFSGTLEALEEMLESDFDHREQQYLSRLSRLAREEERTLHLARRRARKRRYGRVSELDRCTPKVLLNTKRGRAQESHGKIDGKREQRAQDLRDLTREARRALQVRLPMAAFGLMIEDFSSEPLITAQGLTVVRGGKEIVRTLDLTIGQERLALVGPNGSGKTTLLEAMLGERESVTGTVRCERQAIGVIGQGAAEWRLKVSLLEFLSDYLEREPSLNLCAFHRFPLALACRPLRSLSGGERLRAALIAILGTQPNLRMLVLDEPTDNLDLLGQRALREALKGWPGGLLVTSHRRDFLAEIGIERMLELQEGGLQEVSGGGCIRRRPSRLR